MEDDKEFFENLGKEKQPIVPDGLEEGMANMGDGARTLHKIPKNENKIIDSEEPAYKDETLTTSHDLEEMAEKVRSFHTEAEEAVLKKIRKAHKKYMDAKRKLYKTRADFYTAANRKACKEATGKDSDYVFKEYWRKHHLNLEHDREEAEFEYYQALREYETI